jgi:hypothetical protein
MTQIQTEAEQLYLLHSLRRAYERGANRNAWISVDELPQPYTEYLCWDTTKETVCICSHYLGVWTDEQFYERNVSHYQPLPLPPTP